jgi:hypothetical protein
MRASVPRGLSTDSGMSAYLSLPWSVNKKEVKWNGELSEKNGLSHELPFDFTLQVPQGTQVLVSASVNKVGGAADLLGLFFQFAGMKPGGQPNQPPPPPPPTPSTACTAGVNCCYVAKSNDTPPRYSMAIDSSAAPGITILATSGYPNKVFGPAAEPACSKERDRLQAATPTPVPMACTAGVDCCYVGASNSTPPKFAVAIDSSAASGIAILATSGFTNRRFGPALEPACSKERDRLKAANPQPVPTACTAGENCCYVGASNSAPPKFAVAIDSPVASGIAILATSGFPNRRFGPALEPACSNERDRLKAANPPPPPAPCTAGINCCYVAKSNDTPPRYSVAIDTPSASGIAILATSGYPTKMFGPAVEPACSNRRNQLQATNPPPPPAPCKAGVNCCYLAKSNGAPPTYSVAIDTPAAPGSVILASSGYPNMVFGPGVEPACSNKRDQLQTGNQPPNPSTRGDVLGPRLEIDEINGLWSGVWTRRPGTNVFDAVWHSANYPEVRDIVRLEQIDGNQIVFSRDGNNGRYFGTLGADGQTISGTASWYSDGMRWSGKISQTAAPISGQATAIPWQNDQMPGVTQQEPSTPVAPIPGQATEIPWQNDQMPGVTQQEPTTPVLPPNPVVPWKQKPESPVRTESKILDNWNTGGCQLTDTARFTLSAATEITKIELWYNWQRNERAVPYQLVADGRLIQSGELTRGSCDPNQAAWCSASGSIRTTTNAGNHVVRVARGRVCQNAGSGGNGFIRVNAIQ